MGTNKWLIIVFWIIILFNLDPGGFKHSYLNSTQSTIVSILEFIFCLFVLIYYSPLIKYKFSKFYFLKNYILTMSIWFLFYFAIYYGVNINVEYPGLPISILRNFKLIFSSFIVIPIAIFLPLSANIFVRYLVLSTIIIGILFLISTQTSIKIIEIWTATREAGGNLTRKFMYGYGIMFFMIPMFISAWGLKIKIKKKVYAAFLFVISIILITIFRREMIAVLEHLIIISVLVVFIQNKILLRSIFKYLNVKNILGLIIVLIIINIALPQVISSSFRLVNDTLVDLGFIESNYRRVNDIRLNFSGESGIIVAIKENYLFGTGFDPAWFTGDGGKNQWEGADYVFLASFAMYGILGLLLFLPFYIIVVKLVMAFLKLTKSHYNYFVNHKETLLLVVIGLASISEFIRNLIEYPNWFYPIGAISDRGKYFIYLGLLLGSYYGLKSKAETYIERKNELPS